jgi:hypothetical protein
VCGLPPFFFFWPSDDGQRRRIKRGPRRLTYDSSFPAALPFAQLGGFRGAGLRRRGLAGIWFAAPREACPSLCAFLARSVSGLWGRQGGRAAARRGTGTRRKLEAGPPRGWYLPIGLDDDGGGPTLVALPPLPLPLHSSSSPVLSPDEGHRLRAPSSIARFPGR